MLPKEINLPKNSVIYEADHSKFSKMSNNEIEQKISKTKIIQKISNIETLLVINDHQRSTPTYRILKILSKLSPKNKISAIIIASGSHDPPTLDELDKITRGTEEAFNAELFFHSCYDPNLVNYGITSRGTEVILNPIIREYDQILCINSVEPHYFAGFTGGIKSIVPGLAAKETIEKNHSWALSSDTAPLKIDKNPLQLDLWEAGKMVKATLLGIQLVSYQDDIYCVEVGELEESFRRAVSISKSFYSKTIDTKVDVVLSIVYPPLDQTLYQAQKGIENTRSILKENGEMILFARCKKGIGNKEFYETLKQFNAPDEVLENINKENYKFGDHKAYKFASLANYGNITLASELSMTQSQNVFAKLLPIRNLEDHLREISLRNKSVAIVLDSGSLVLNLNQS